MYRISLYHIKQLIAVYPVRIERNMAGKKKPEYIRIAVYPVRIERGLSFNMFTVGAKLQFIQLGLKGKSLVMHDGNKMYCSLSS